MPRQTGLPAALARFGLKVELTPGWETRGSANFNPVGALSHWTAGPRGSKTRPSLNICINGRAGLPGPLANVYLDRNGVAVVLAAGVANHGGVGNWRGYSGNSRFFGTEAECGGDGDWTAAQRVAYPRVNAAYCWLGKFGPEMCAGHHEYATPAGRKIDVRDWPMSAMRSQVAAVLAGGSTSAPTPTEDDMTPDQAKQLADLTYLVSTHLAPAVGRIDANAAALNRTLDYRHHHGNPDDNLLGHVLSVRQALGRIAGADADAIAAAIPADLAEQVASKLAERLRD